MGMNFKQTWRVNPDAQGQGPGLARTGKKGRTALSEGFNAKGLWNQQEATRNTVGVQAKSTGLGGWIPGFHSKLLCDLSQDSSLLQALTSHLYIGYISPGGTQGPFPLGESVWT